VSDELSQPSEGYIRLLLLNELGLSNEVSPVDDDLLTGHECAFVAGQVKHGIGNVELGTDVLHRHALSEFSQLFLLRFGAGPSRSPVVIGLRMKPGDTQLTRTVRLALTTE